jgi:cytochrome P450
MTIFRKITKDIQLTGKNNTVHNVKAGSATIALEITAMHRNPDLWSDPLEFKPERWLDNKAKPGFVAFGAGARICPGMNLSLLEQRVVLSMLLRRYEWSLPIDSPHQNGVKASGFFFAKPDPMYMHIRRVQP